MTVSIAHGLGTAFSSSSDAPWLFSSLGSDYLIEPRSVGKKTYRDL